MEAKILKAISETMTCDKCPYPCQAKENSSQANCVAQWAEMLSKINPNSDWKEIKHEVARMVQANQRIFMQLDLGKYVCGITGHPCSGCSWCCEHRKEKREAIPLDQ